MIWIKAVAELVDTGGDLKVKSGKSGNLLKISRACLEPQVAYFVELDSLFASVRGD